MGVYISAHSVYLPEYTSTATMVVTAKGSTSSAYGNYSLSSDLAKIFANIFSDPVIKTKAGEYLGDSFDGRISAKANSGTNFIDLSVTSDNPVKSYQLLNAVLETYPQVSDYLFDNATVMLLKAPSVPRSPSNKMSEDNVALIQTGCAVVSAFIIVVLSVFRDTVKNEDDFNEKIGAKLIGVIRHEKKHMRISEILKRKKRSLRIFSNAFVSFTFVENFYKIAAKLEYMKRKNEDNIFVVTSVAENEGKSTVATNVAIALANKGKKVVLLDFDFKKPALYKIFEIDYGKEADIGLLFEGKTEKSDFHFIRYKGLPLMIAGCKDYCKDSPKWIERGILEQFVKSISSQVDYVIIDTPPCFADSGITGIVQFAHKVIMVTRTDVVKADTINKTLQTLKSVGANVAGCILNDAYPDFAPIDLLGTDETGAYSKLGYGKYEKYKKYGQYGKYGKYSKYGRYSAYSRYSSAAKYGYYSHSNLTED